jgi:hypothetical protein
MICFWLLRKRLVKVWVRGNQDHVLVKTSGEPHSKEEAAGSVLREKIKVTAELGM